MSKNSFKIVVLSRDKHSPFILEHSDFQSAIAEVGKMQDAMVDANGNFVDEYSFDNDDMIAITDPDNEIVFAWQRHSDIAPSEITKIDFENVSRGFMGWQILNPEGYNMHGDPDDPFELPSYAILADDAVDVAKDWVRDNEGYRLAPVYEDVIEEPVWVHELSRPGPRL